MTSKAPTPQGISALLRKAGFERSDYDSRGSSTGFRVTKDYGHDGAVRVRHYFLSMAPQAERRKEMLARYVKAITEAGWSVEAGEWELIVTAGKAEQ